MSTVRRAYFYAVSLVTEVLWAWGAGILLKLIFEEIAGSQAIITRSSGYPAQQLALGLSLFLIPGVVWLLHWRAVQGHAARDPEESGSALRKLFLSAILTASALTALMTAIKVVRWLLGGASAQSLPAGALATMLVALCIWYYNKRTDDGDATASASGQTLHRWYLYVTSSWSLVILSIGVINVLAVMLDWTLGGTALIRGSLWSPQTQLHVASAILGVTWWAYHWLHAARADAGSSLRQVYLYLLAITGGAVTALASLTIILFNLVKLAAYGFRTGIVSHQYLVWTVPATLVGAAVLSYHWQVAKEEASKFEDRRSSAKRVYHYLLSGLGLLELTAGMAYLVGLLLDLLLGVLDPSYDIINSPDWGKGQVALFLSLVAVGLAVWSHFWTRVQRDTATLADERTTRSRKVYLYAFLSMSVIALVVGLISVLRQLVAAFLGASSFFNAFADMKWGLQIAVVAVPVLAYHLKLLRDDMRSGSETRAHAKEVVAVLDRDLATTAIPRLEKALGYRVRLIALEGASGIGPAAEAVTDEMLDDLARTISSSARAKLLLTAQGGVLAVYPYEEREK